ncbi:hypothetical protein QQF64_010658, partial [Cirrhinus molitorella]
CSGAAQHESQIKFNYPALVRINSRVKNMTRERPSHVIGDGLKTQPQAPSSPSSPSANEPKYEKRWLDAVSLPLFMARISRRKAGTDKLRSNSFEVIALDGVCTHVLQFCTAAESTDWLQAISTNINDLTQESIKTANKYSSPDDQIVHMGWVCEHLQGGDIEPVHSCRFLALRGSSLLVFRSPPILASDWAQAEASFHLCEVLFKVHKLWIAEDCWIQTKFYMGLQQDGELRDSEPFCFSVLVGHGQSFCYSVELGSELVLWEKAFQRAVFMEVQRVRSKSYMCSSQGKILCFTLDFESGFSCSDSISKKTIWKYKFSQLKGSSDDGKTRVKLLFQNSENKQIEMKELEFANLTAVLHCIHSFIAAKVATVDPVFVNNQRHLNRREELQEPGLTSNELVLLFLSSIIDASRSQFHSEVQEHQTLSKTQQRPEHRGESTQPAGKAQTNASQHKTTETRGQQGHGWRSDAFNLCHYVLQSEHRFIQFNPVYVASFTCISAYI